MLTKHRIINHALEIIAVLIAICGVLGIFIPQNDADYLILIQLPIIWLIRFLNTKFDWGFTETHFSLGMLFMYAHIFGDNFFNFYYTITIYDKILHSIIPLLMTYILAESKLLKEKFFLTIFIVMGILGIFEVAEYMIDQASSAILQGVMLTQRQVEYMTPHTDTMTDLLFGFLSSIAGYFAFVIKNKHKKYAKLKKKRIIL